MEVRELSYHLGQQGYKALADKGCSVVNHVQVNVVKKI